MIEPDAAKPEGQRARGKAQKLRRIRDAARALFIEKGYDDTTTREIAHRAGVGLGTLFTYAADKRDLLFLIFNDELEAVAARAFAEPGKAPFIDQLIAAFHEFYAFFAKQPHLARFMLRELTFYVTGVEARRFQRHREQIVVNLAEMVRRAKQQGGVDAGESDLVIGHAIFALYAAEIRHWLADDDSEPEIKQGLVTLRRTLNILITGLAPQHGRR